MHGSIFLPEPAGKHGQHRLLRHYTLALLNPGCAQVEVAEEHWLQVQCIRTDDQSVWAPEVRAAKPYTLIGGGTGVEFRGHLFCGSESDGLQTRRCCGAKGLYISIAAQKLEGTGEDCTL